MSNTLVTKLYFDVSSIDDRLLSSVKSLQNVIGIHGEVEERPGNALFIYIDLPVTETFLIQLKNKLVGLGASARWGSVVKIESEGKADVYGVGPSEDLIRLALEQEEATRQAEDEYWDKIQALV